MSLSDQFDALDLNTINSYLTSQQEEHLHLDFKILNKPDLSHADDKKNLAKASSGFANSNGGLIVWGIDARKNLQGIDCASGTQEIEPLTLLVARLNELTSRATDPPVDGVRHKSIVSSGNRGFAVTLVPESESGPHMAKLGEDRYYKRSGDTFYKMEHFDLEDMFGRRKKPKLSLEVRIIRPSEIVIGIKNEGRGTAKAPYLSFSVPEPFSVALYGLDGNGNDGLPKLHHAGNNSRQPKYGANLSAVIHPNTTLEVTKLEFRGREENRPSGQFVLEYEVAAEDIQIVRSAITIIVPTVGLHAP